MPETVCVTGASGFIGSHIVAALLENGFFVVALVRNPGSPAYLQLREFCGSRDTRLEIHAANLLTPGSYDSHFARCSHVIHTAGEVTQRIRPNRAESRRIISVNIEGASNVLRAVGSSPQIRKLVLTSSMSAVLSSQKDPRYRFTEADWNTDPPEASAPYWFSKTAQERQFTKAFAENAGQRETRLVCINPSVVIGPVFSAQHTRTSVGLVQDLYTGALPGCPNFYFSLVDVRDVALAHVRALTESSTEGRFLMPGRSVSMQVLSRMIREAFPNSKAPLRRIPDWLMYLVVPFNRTLSVRYLRDYLGVERLFDDSKLRDKFQIEYRPLRETIVDTIRSVGALAT
jgi:nucleoside-diphosphate-sugar epimerase